VVAACDPACVGMRRPVGRLCWRTPLSRYFHAGEACIRGVGGWGVLDDLSRRVGVLAKRAATTLSWVGVVCHDVTDYQPVLSARS
jgi:hypothetical protein